MKSNRINDLFENKYGMSFQPAIDLIKSYFAKHLPGYILLAEYKETSGYWGIRYSYREIKVFIGCDRGLLDVKLLVIDKDISLFEFKPLMVNIKVASEKNIQFVLNVLKQFTRTIPDGQSI